MDPTLQTYKKIYKDYAMQNASNADVAGFIKEFLGFLKGKKILDVGCGHGRDSAFFAREGLEVTGIDFVPEFIELSRQACPEGNFEVMDMTKLTLPDESFDGVWVCASFLHIPKKQALDTLKGFYRVLKPGGIIYVAVKKGSFEGLRENKALNWGARYFSDYTVSELEALTEKAGFKTLKAPENITPWGATFINLFAEKSQD